MYSNRLFMAIGMIRQARPGGFCPACRVLMKVRDARQELAKPMVAALVVLAFARTAEKRRGWQVATGVLALTYLGVWLLFGVVCYAVYTAASMPWPNQAPVARLALALAGVYSVSPLKRA